MQTRVLSRAALAPALLFSSLALAQPVVVVLEHGEAPREELRYQFAAGPAVPMSMTMEMTMSMPGQPAPMRAVPPIRVPVSIRTTEVYADGTARYEYEMGTATFVEDAGGSPVNAQMLSAMFGQMAGTTGWARMDTRGNTLDGSFGAPSVDGPLGQALGDLSSQMQGQMQQMSAPFPAEAIGIGARWQQISTLQMGGASFTQTTEYTLLARDGNRIELETKLLQSDATPPPGATAEVQATLDGRTAIGGGLMSIDLTRQIAAFEMTTNQSMGMPGQSPAPGMSMNMQMKMSIQPD